VGAEVVRGFRENGPSQEESDQQKINSPGVRGAATKRGGFFGRG